MPILRTLNLKVIRKYVNIFNLPMNLKINNCIVKLLSQSILNCQRCISIKVERATYGLRAESGPPIEMFRLQSVFILKNT